jgi:DNA repair protein RadD
MTLSLRPYQREAIDALFAYWQAGKGNGLLVLPTGAGKSLVLAALSQELLRDYPTLRIGIVTHVRELIQQNYQELLRLWPQAPAGIYSAGIGRRDTRAQILFCGIQSVWNKVDLLGGFDLLLVDEAHLIPANAQTTYGKFIAKLKEESSDLRVAGLTATPFRMDSGRLDRGQGKIFDDVVYEANVADLIEQGYLCPLISKATAQQLDVSQVPKRGGEYVAGLLEVAVDKDWITRAAVQEMAQFGAERKSWLAFCAGVKHAGNVCEAVRAAGFTCEVVTGETPKGERDRIVNQFRAGHIRCLTSVGVLGTGFNVPAVDMIALLRPTNSAGLFVQQVGRGLRNAPGKQNCLVLDFAGLVKKHGPIDTVTANGASKLKGDPEERILAKECPVCATLVALAARTCPTCAHEWPMREEPPKHEATADAVSAIVSKGAPSWVAVDAVRFYIHKKDGSADSLRVEYQCGFTTHKEWLGFAAVGLFRQKAERFWLASAGQPIPRTALEALDRQRECRAVEAIQVRPDGKFFSVVGRRFEPVEAIGEAAE